VTSDGYLKEMALMSRHFGITCTTMGRKKISKAMK
jgi:hypothetical protein